MRGPGLGPGGHVTKEIIQDTALGQISIQKGLYGLATNRNLRIISNIFDK